MPEGDVPGAGRQWVSKSAASRHFVALSAARMKEWMTSDLSKLDLLVVQIDCIHMTGELVRGGGVRCDRCHGQVSHPNSSCPATSSKPLKLQLFRSAEVSASFDRFCLAAGIETLGAMMEAEHVGHGIRAARTGAVIAGGARRARSVSTLVRS